MIQGNKDSILEQLTGHLWPDRFYSVMVEEMGMPRTKGQNDRFYSALRRMSEYSGYTEGELKDMAMERAFGREVSTSELDTRMMATLIDVAQQMEAEMGIYDIH